MLVNDNVYSMIATGQDFDYSLFKIAIRAAEDGLNVWFLASEKIKKTPENINKVPDKEILKHITFMYFEDYNELVKHFNGIHLWRHLPDLILISGFEKYFNLTEFNNVKASFLVTSLLDSAAFCAKMKNRKVSLAATCTNSHHTEKLQILKDLYFQEYLVKCNDEQFCDYVLNKIT